jgi:hypothetical protein
VRPVTDPAAVWLIGGWRGCPAAPHKAGIHPAAQIHPPGPGTRLAQPPQNDDPAITLPACSAAYSQASRSTSRSSFSASVAGVDGAARLELQHRGFGVGARAVLNPAGHNEKLPRPQYDIAISHLDGQLSAEYQEELVSVGMPVPGELALDLHDPDLVVVDLGDRFR